MNSHLSIISLSNNSLTANSIPFHGGGGCKSFFSLFYGHGGDRGKIVGKIIT